MIVIVVMTMCMFVMGGAVCFRSLRVYIMIRVRHWYAFKKICLQSWAMARNSTWADGVQRRST